MPISPNQFFCPFRNHWRNFWIVVRVFRAQLGLICVRQVQVWPYLSVDEQCEVSRSDGLRCDFSSYDINEQYLSIISNPLRGFSNHKRYPQILCGLWLNHVRYPQILCGPCSCDSRFFLVIPYIYSLLRGGFYNASSGFGPEAKTLRGQLSINNFNSKIGPGTQNRTRMLLSFRSELNCCFFTDAPCSLLVIGLHNKPAFSSIRIVRTKDGNWTLKQIPLAWNSLPEWMLSC